MRGPFVRNGRYEIRMATMVDLIRTAWGVDAERVVGGPNWLEDDTFDVMAKVPAGTTAATAEPMLQALLADRFQLAVHNDTKPVLAYALKVDKRLQMKSATLNDRVVVDQTDLKGTWDFDLKFAPRFLIASGGTLPGSISLFEAIEKLGLRLDPVEVPLPVIVVDRVNEKPTPNPPKVAEALHETPPPREFEVAELKPTPPDFRGGRIQIQPGGRVNIAGIPLKFLIQQAWDVNNDRLVGALPWMDTDRYDIVAKAEVDERQMESDVFWTLLRTLLAERFKLAVHTENRPAEAFTLVAVKPKLKKSDSATRTKCKEGPGADGKDPRDKTPILSRLLTCQGITMAQFADRLSTLANGYIHSPVLDATGLEGRYDFTLSFSPAGMGQVAGRGGRGGGESGPFAPSLLPDPSAATSDPIGAISVFEAIEKQLGLKLETQKRPVPVLVIDHAERKPIEN
jgi:uncharacterized protein (TIGR03435 family)